ncbi:unnamed protein product [Hymenolepis diminuta]|uniref:TACC_C domain-containing protein n=1 Tax=Hymenolepis diminuta TaxID=6216 RepID=A0A0R3SYR6_HYMDI|nr:unnamed protein product [Hymenolepis diminuta]
METLDMAVGGDWTILNLFGPPPETRLTEMRKIEDAVTKNNIALTENKRAYEEAKSKLASTESELQTKLEILAIYQEVENRLDEAMQQVEELEVAHAQQAIKKQRGDVRYSFSLNTV